MSTKLFPRYLKQGSTGAAVNMLGFIMMIIGYEIPEKPIVLDGDYATDGAIATAVKSFQGTYGLIIDGNFGPDERSTLKTEFSIDVDTLTVEMFTAPTIGVEP